MTKYPFLMLWTGICAVIVAVIKAGEFRLLDVAERVIGTMVLAAFLAFGYELVKDARARPRRESSDTARLVEPARAVGGTEAAVPKAPHPRSWRAISGRGQG